jgi:hypothetical protein
MEKAVMLRCFLVLLVVVLGASPSHSQEPYCELGYGTCGGACNEEGKKPWDCPADALPCYQKSQHCSCETADMCKPKKKKKSELSHPLTPSSQASLPAAQSNQAAR